MYHVVQDDLFNEYGFKSLLNALEGNNCQYTVVKVIPFAHELIPDINPQGDVMVWGATTLGHIAVERGWKPGRFQNEKFDMRYLSKRFGPYMLNADAKFCTFDELQYEGLKFIRPVHDSKSFSGTVMDGAELAAWKQKVLDVSDGYATLRPETPVMYAEPKNIDLEARFFIVDGSVVSGSSYRSLGRQILYQRIDGNNPLFSPMVDFVRDMLAVDFTKADSYDSTYAEPVAKAYVMDIGLIGNDYKVVEINTINSAGFYATDMSAVVRAIENM